MGVSEIERLAALNDLRILDTDRSPEFDAITTLAAQYFDVPLCAISLLDKDRQWFKSEVGLGCNQTSRDVSFCQYTIQEEDSLVVADATLDPRFSSYPLVVGEPHIRFDLSPAI